MSVSDTDWEILNHRLTEIERSLGILQAYVDTSLKEKYYGDNGDVAYVLKKGSLVDSGLLGGGLMQPIDNSGLWRSKDV